MRLLERARPARDVHIVPRLAGIRKRVFSPGAQKDFDAFFEAGLSAVAIESMLEIIPRYPSPQSDVQTSAGEDIQDRAFFGEAHRVVERQNIHQIAEAQASRALRERGDNEIR